MKIKENQLAPDFTVTDIDGKVIRLSNYRGKKILLSFFRNVNCPFCNRRVHKLMGLKYRFEQANMQLLFFFESSNQKILSSVFHKGISPLPVIGDPEKKIYRLYGVEESLVKTLSTILYSNYGKARKDTAELNLPEDKEATQTLIPADILINKDFTINRAYYGKHLDDHIGIPDLEKFAGITSVFAKK